MLLFRSKKNKVIKFVKKSVNYAYTEKYLRANYFHGLSVFGQNIHS